MRYKTGVMALLFSFYCFFTFSQGLEDIIVEKIPVTPGALEADTALPEGAVAYRVFVDMAPGYGMQAVFALATHEMVLETTTKFYNYYDGVTFGRTMPNGVFRDSAGKFDSYITVDGVTNSRVGILLDEDVTDGIKDGYTTGTSLVLQTIGDNFEVPFGTEKYPGKFSTFSGIYNVNGVEFGTTPANRVLIGQFTTDGDFSFELNIQIKDTATGKGERYVARNPQPNEIIYRKLIYPFNPGPVVNITSPDEGETVTTGDSVLIEAAATDVNGVAYVEFFINSVKTVKDSLAPYQFKWKSEEGFIKIYAVGYDSLGANDTSGVVNITVGDIVPPEVVITSPSANDKYVAGTLINLSADATDTDGTISKVEFLINGTVIGEDSSSPYSFSWLSTPGAKTVSAIATDNVGAKDTSEVINIMILKEPEVKIENPISNSGIIYLKGQPINIQATVTDSDGTILLVEFFINNNKIGEDYASPYSFIWSPSETSSSVAIKVKATDSDSLKTESAVFISVKASPEISLEAPLADSTYKTNNNITITANASDPDGSVALVEFYINNAKVGEDNSIPYEHNWTPTQPGNYNIKAVSTDNDNISDSSMVAVKVQNPVGMQNIENNDDIHIYPNPVQDKLSIKMNVQGNESEFSYMLTDILGNVVKNGGLVYKKQILVIDMSGLSKGIYILNLKSGHNLVLVKRIIKN
ncbi:MAG: T9SS type A sorting domain-containing protein [Bacteroidales bacterium]|nr:T9SS type A sorting domain-containing protein [Bacteroidales bacterium]